MPLYHYQALESDGKKRSSFIEAHNEREAKDILRQQGLMIVNLSEKNNTTSKQKLKGESLVTFTLQLSQLVNARLPIYESLMVLEEQYRQESYHRIILSLSEQIKAGSSLSEAMGSFPETFDRLYRSMILAGESSGALDMVLEKLSVLLRKKMKLEKQIMTSMIYPGILASFSLLIILLLLGFVVPSIEGIFEGRTLNSFTRLVINVSHFFRGYWWLYLPLSLFSIFLFFAKIRSPSGKLFLEKIGLKLPLIKNLMIQAAVARFCRTMSTLQLGGLTMIDSLRMSREVMQNATLEKEMIQAEEKIIEGNSLSSELMLSKWIPSLVPRMLSVGEESGSTTIMLGKIAEMYEEEIEKSLDRVVALAQPVILMVMGVVIGFVLLAILLPLTDISSFTH